MIARCSSVCCRNLVRVCLFRFVFANLVFKVCCKLSATNCLLQIVCCFSAAAVSIQLVQIQIMLRFRFATEDTADCVLFFLWTSLGHVLRIALTITFELNCHFQSHLLSSNSGHVQEHVQPDSNG